MSMFYCEACGDTRDADDGYEVLLGREICGRCLDAIPEPKDATPRSALFRLAAAVTIQQYMTPELPEDCAAEGLYEPEYPTTKEQMWDL